MDAMKYNDLRDFLTLLEQQGEPKTYHAPRWIRIWKSLKLLTVLCVPVGLRCCSKTLKATQCRCCATCSVRQSAWRWAWGRKMFRRLREVGKLLAFLKEPEPPKGFRDLFDKLPQF
ncbi:3-octaprenyl-4-hydroxybenzoate carboxy-lyase [Escherichia coli]|nr:3-octaprenyl-4-hydroxybenzoate carboxy-lyase [Escherichia coli]